jgi:Zn-dependent protease
VSSRPAQSPVSPFFLALVAITVGGGWLCANKTGVLLTVGVVLLVLGGWAVSLCLHEFGHAAVAYRGGDLAVAQKGYLTLDIRRYADLGLSLVLPLVFLILGAVPLPGGAVWINNWAIRSRPVRSLVSLAGPLINLVLGVSLALSTALVSMPDGLRDGLSYLALVQLLAFVLNILPVPGLDGWGVLEPYLPAETREFGARIRPWAPLVLFLVLLGLPKASSFFFGAGLGLLWLSHGDPSGALYGYSQFMFWRN